MTREKLLKSREYWIFEIQNKLYSAIENYRSKKKITKSKLAEELGVNKSYVTQVLNGSFDHKISKLVELSLACNTVPVVYFVEKDKYISDDAAGKSYHLIPMHHSSPVVFTATADTSNKQSPAIDYTAFYVKKDQQVELIDRKVSSNSNSTLQLQE